MIPKVIPKGRFPYEEYMKENEILSDDSVSAPFHI